MTTSKKRIFWDSNVFIRFLSRTGDPLKLQEQEDCRRCLQSAIEGKTEIVASTVSIAEVVKTEDLVHPPVPEHVRERIRDLFNEPYVVLVSADLGIAQDARNLIWSHSWLGAVDAILIASALYAKVDEMYSYDGLGDRKGPLDLDGKIGVPALRVKKPHFEGQIPFQPT